VWHAAYVGLGSNLDDPAARVRQAFTQLADISETRLVARSHLYRSAPLGPPDQPHYVNAVAGLLTQRAPGTLLAALQAIERQHGRDRSGPKWGPRTLDLDLLLYGEQHIGTPTLVVPHPRAHERAFVLAPLDEIAPGLVIPGRGAVADLRATLAAQRVDRLP